MFSRNMVGEIKTIKVGIQISFYVGELNIKEVLEIFVGVFF
jgi:hypothetical protein